MLSLCRYLLFGLIIFCFASEWASGHQTGLPHSHPHDARTAGLVNLGTLLIAAIISATLIVALRFWLAKKKTELKY